MKTILFLNGPFENQIRTISMDMYDRGFIEVAIAPPTPDLFEDAKVAKREALMTMEIVRYRIVGNNAILDDEK